MGIHNKFYGSALCLKFPSNIYWLKLEVLKQYELYLTLFTKFSTVPVAQWTQHWAPKTKEHGSNLCSFFFQFCAYFIGKIPVEFIGTAPKVKPIIKLISVFQELKVFPYNRSNLSKLGASDFRHDYKVLNSRNYRSRIQQCMLCSHESGVEVSATFIH